LGVAFDYRSGHPEQRRGVALARPLLVLATIAWVGLLLAAPAASLGVPLSAATYAFGSLICHQQPGRSFHLDAAQLPVCARCFGLYVGAIAGAVAAVKPTTRRTLRLLVLAAAVPTAVTWTAEAVGLWLPSNTTRFVAALPLGAAVAVTVNYVGCARPLRPESRAPRSLT